MFSLVKKMSVSIFVGKNYSSGKIIVGKKIVGKKFVTGKKIHDFLPPLFLWLTVLIIFSNYNYFCNTSISHSLFYGTIIMNFLIQVKILLQKDILYIKNRDQEGRGR